MDRRNFLAGSTLALTSAGALAAEAPQVDEGSAASASLPVPAGIPSEVKDIAPLASLNDLEGMAKAVMSAGAFVHVAHGAGNEWTFHENFRSIERVQIKPAYLSQNTKPELGIKLLGSSLQLPLYTCPMGSHGIVHASAEEGTSRGTGESGALMMLSTAANRTVEAVASVNNGPKWLQLYITPDQAMNQTVIRQAKVAGYTAIVISVDAPAAGVADDVIRLGFKFPPLPKPYLARGIKSGLGWSDIEMVMRESNLPVLLKGVLTPELADEAMKRGLAGVVVSNHGGRQIDGLPGSMDALPAVVKAVKGRGVVLVDGGFRRGADVFRALASGADAVGIGRPVLFGLAVGGWKGVHSAYARLAQELAFTMNVAGASRISDITSKFVMKPQSA